MIQRPLFFLGYFLTIRLFIDQLRPQKRFILFQVRIDAPTEIYHAKWGCRAYVVLLNKSFSITFGRLLKKC